MSTIATIPAKKRKLRHCKEDRRLYAVVNILMILLAIVILYPMIYVVSSSFSSGQAVASGQVFLLPVDFSLKGYELVFAYKQVWVGYRNAIFYTVVGTVFNLLLNTLAAYPLARRNFQGKGFYMTFFMIPMFFSGGLIPTYILMTKLHLVNTPWVMIFNAALSIHNMIVMRTYFQNSIPGELHEAARIDGISDIGYLLKVVIPLSKAIFAVITLYYAVGHWNAYFGAMVYLRDRELFPLQLVLRDILNANQIDLSQIEDTELLKQLTNATDVMRYALIIVSSVPVLVAYPFVQKFFEKGVMIGSVKG